jgi:hypothetical protein
MELENKPLTKAELKLKMKNKMASFKNHQPSNRQPISEKDYNKMMNEARHEIQNLQKDDRVTPRMIELYKKTCNEYKQVTIPSPLEMLNNQEEARSKLREYYGTLINNCKEMNISREKFVSDYLNSSYTKYHIEVLGIDCVPEKLRPDLIC